MKKKKAGKNTSAVCDMLLPSQARNPKIYYKSDYNDHFLLYWALKTRKRVVVGESHCIF